MVTLEKGTGLWSQLTPVSSVSFWRTFHTHREVHALPLPNSGVVSRGGGGGLWVVLVDPSQEPYIENRPERVSRVTQECSEASIPSPSLSRERILKADNDSATNWVVCSWVFNSFSKPSINSFLSPPPPPPPPRAFGPLPCPGRREFYRRHFTGVWFEHILREGVGEGAWGQEHDLWAIVSHTAIPAAHSFHNVLVGVSWQGHRYNWSRDMCDKAFLRDTLHTCNAVPRRTRRSLTSVLLDIWYFFQGINREDRRCKLTADFYYKLVRSFGKSHYEHRDNDYCHATCADKHGSPFTRLSRHRMSRLQSGTLAGDRVSGKESVRTVIWSRAPASPPRLCSPTYHPRQTLLKNGLLFVFKFSCATTRVP